jgi:hypothetical protein
MADEQPQPTPIALTQALVFIMEQTWPQVTTFTDDFLRNSAHTRGAVYDEQAGTLTFDIFNGGATYALLANPLLPAGPHLGTLVEGSARKTTRRP